MSAGSFRALAQARPDGPAARRARPVERWIDRIAGSDPGLNRLSMALRTVLSIAAILAAEALFVHFTHALQIPVPAGAKIPAAQVAKIAAANHDFLVISMMLGAIIGMMAGFGVTDSTARGQLASMLFFPVSMIPALALGIAIGGYRVPALASLAVLLTIGTYFRRFGPRGFASGAMLFMGDFLGFFLHGAVSLGDLGWLAAEAGVGVAVAIAVGFTLFYPRPAKALQRTQRSYAARECRVAALALELFDRPGHGERDARRLQRHLVRLNEAALMIDAQLGDPGTVPDGSSAQLLHQRLFDAELALTNVARFARAMVGLALPAGQREEARRALLAITGQDAAAARAHAARLIEILRAAGHPPAGEDRVAVVIPRRFAASVIALADAMTEWMALGSTSGGQAAFQPSVTLFGGWLPGSSQVSTVASLEPGSHWADRLRLAPYTRAAIQMGVAVGAATALGDLVSGRRYYWAVIAAFITFMGTNNSGEQVRKAVFRVAGTAVGIVLGSLLVTAVGHHPYWSIAVILAALFLGFYLFRINYAFMVIGITVAVSQLYLQLDEFSNSLLLLRLAETALGAAVAAAVVLLVLPLRTRRVLRIALRNHVRAISEMTGHAASALIGESDGARSTLRADARAVDVSYQALVATVQPLRRNLSGSLDEDTGQAERLASASRHYCRNLVADVEAAGRLDAATRLSVRQASAALQDSLEVVAGALTGPRDVVYTRSSALFDQAERHLEECSGTVEPSQLAIRDLKLIDGSMAQLAQGMGLAISDYDTAMVGPASFRGASVHGRVQAGNGAGAAVILADSRGAQAARTLAAANGRYRLDVPAGRYLLIAFAASRGLASRTVVLRDGEDIRADLDLAGPARLSGQVTAAGGRPVPQARITLLDTTGEVVAVAGADQTGRYTIGGLAQGEYTAIASGYPAAVSALHIAGGDHLVQHDVELKYPKGAPEGTGQPSATVMGA